MAGFFNKIKITGTASGHSSGKDATHKKKDDSSADLTPLEKMLQNAGPLRDDGSDRFYGFENFGNTCYCNSVVQALFYSDLFRDSVINYPLQLPADTADAPRPRVNVTIRPPIKADTTPVQNGKHKALPTAQVLKTSPGPGQPIRPEDKPDTPEYKKKHAMLKGPIVELKEENGEAYGMEECTFTGLKDIFLALMESKTHTGVLSPQRFLEIFKRDNELFRNSMHQDAHEFYGLVLNDVITNVEAYARKVSRQEESQQETQQPDLTQSLQRIAGSAYASNITEPRSLGVGWVHDIFEGVLTSETMCLTCTKGSQRDETFLDLSIDLEEHSSVTSCLRKFSDEEMLCERNKFHCDHCGGLQEAEKRMKVKKLPKVLTLHLKRFKYTEDYSRLQKLFHRVVYPYHLRMFNTTEDAEDQDRLYELYAVVVHIGGNAYHGHYVSIIKTKDRGWVLFDDEMVEPVDKHFVRNFFGDRPGMATAYVLFYQETTFEKVRDEMEREGMEEVELATLAATFAKDADDKGDGTHASNLKRVSTQPMKSVDPTGLTGADTLSKLAHANTTAADSYVPASPTTAHGASVTSPSQHVLASAPTDLGVSSVLKKKGGKTDLNSRETRKLEKKARDAAEKAEKLAEKERKEKSKQEHKRRQEEQAAGPQTGRKEHEGSQGTMDSNKRISPKEDDTRKKDNGGSDHFGVLDRPKRGSRSLAKRSLSFFNNNKDKGSNNSIPEGPGGGNGEPSEVKEGFQTRLSSALGKKKSLNLLS